MLAARPLAARLIVAASLAPLCLAVFASKALARDLYVVDFGSSTVSVIDSATTTPLPAASPSVLIT